MSATQMALLRYTVAGIFLLAAISKSLDFQGLIDSVSRLGAFPPGWTHPIAVVLLMAEFATALLLLSHRSVRAGAALGGLMAAGFLAVTGSLLIQGVSAECACFGVFLRLPPAVMLGVDACLLVCCWLLLRDDGKAFVVTPEAHPQSAETVTTIQKRRLALSNRLASFLIPAYFVTMAAMLQSGFSQERERVAQAYAEPTTITLRYGDPAPDFILPSASGAPVLSASFRGKWTLLLFVDPWCEPCKDEVRDVSAQYPRWKFRLNMAVILMGKPLFLTAEGAARRFADAMKLPMTVLCDADRKVARRYCDRPIRTPFSVLLDSRGIVRFIQNARETGELSLVKDIETLLYDAPYRNVVYVFPSRQSAEASARSFSTQGIVAADESRTVHMAFQAWNAPTTFLIKEGRLLYASSERSSEHELVQLLQRSERLSLTGFPSQGE